MSRRILIVSDGVLNAATWSVLSERGFDPIVVENADHAYERLTSAQFDLMVIGLEQPIEGAEIIKWIRAHEKLAGFDFSDRRMGHRRSDDGAGSRCRRG